jgi:hypothetical protein
MEDAKIDLIAREVLTSLKKARSEGAGSVPVAPPSAVSPAPPSDQRATPFHLQLLSVTGGVVGSPCVIEPDKTCIGSLRCRSFGH